MKIFRIIISALCTLLLFQVYFSFAEIAPPDIYEHDNAISGAYKKNQDYLFLNEGFSIGTINQGGYLGKYYPPQRKPGTLRIALIGDSFIQSFQVFERDNFASVMSDSLRSLNAEVLPFGYSGYQLENMVILYERIVSHYSPDINLYFLDELDFTDFTAENLPVYKVKRDSLIVINEPAKRDNKSFVTKMFSHSALLQFFYSFFKNFNIADLTDKISGKFAPVKQEQNPPHFFNKKSGLLLRKLASMNDAHRAKNILVLNIRNRQIPEEYLKLIKELNIPYIDLSIPFNNLIRKNTDPFFWKATRVSGHWNNAAHKEIGIYLSECIKQMVK